MSQVFHQLFGADSLEGFLSLLLGCFLYFILVLVPVLAALYGLYFLLTLPMRRAERARHFLDLLELGLNNGQTPENAVVEAASSRDRSMGVRFHLLAAFLQQGLRLSDALDHVPRLVGPEVTALLKVGERIGSVAKVLPAARLKLADGISHVRSAINYVVVMAFVLTPFTVAIPLVVKVKVLPAFAAVFEDLRLPGFTRFVFGADTWYLGFQSSLMALVWLAAFAYLAGPRLRRVLEFVWPGELGWLDSLLLRVPWRRKRLQRDFSAMLAVLLEAGVPESEAVRLAADATANLVFRRRAQKAALQLGKGVRLPEALRGVDNSGELHWRIGNALQRSGGFVRALRGWHEALDAKAFQQEQAIAQVITSVLVLINGFIVACIVIGVFLPLIQLMHQAAL